MATTASDIFGEVMDWSGGEGHTMGVSAGSTSVDVDVDGDGDGDGATGRGQWRRAAAQMQEAKKPSASLGRPGKRASSEQRGPRRHAIQLAKVPTAGRAGVAASRESHTDTENRRLGGGQVGARGHGHG